jgi:hypothetical protein
VAIEDEVKDHENRITVLEHTVEEVKTSVGTICNDFKEFTKPGGVFEQLQASVTKMSGSNDTLLTLVKYVVLPLIIIVGALVGVKIAWPTG